LFKKLDIKKKQDLKKYGLVFLYPISIIFVTKYQKMKKNRHEFTFRTLKKEERTKNVK